jgi:sugar O-acyltransferase (sialic acid O-acetyltransferase NeuD family)
MTSPLLILGAGGHGKVVADACLAAGGRVAGFVDADPDLTGDEVLGLPVLGVVNRLEHLAREHGVAAVALGVGDNRARLELAREVRRANLDLATVVHPRATVAASAVLGPGVVICAGAAVCVEARVGAASIVNTNAVVDHECVLGEATHVCPAAALAGRVSVAEGGFVGIGASVLPCLSIGAWAVVGAGAVVREDAPAAATVVGVPARSL